jgi:hypothetical protein
MGVSLSNNKFTNSIPIQLFTCSIISFAILSTCSTKVRKMKIVGMEVKTYEVKTMEWGKAKKGRWGEGM